MKQWGTVFWPREEEKGRNEETVEEVKVQRERGKKSGRGQRRNGVILSENTGLEGRK